MRKIIFIILLNILLLNLVVHATSGRTNSSGCHNSKSAGYHCHNSGYTPTYDYTSSSVSRSLLDTEILEKIKEGIKCSQLENFEDKKACYKIESEGDIYEYEIIFEELKKTKSCDKFYEYQQNQNECSILMKNENIYTLEEIKKFTYNYSRCDKLEKFQKDYKICTSQKLKKKKKAEEDKKLKKKNAKIQSKLDAVNKKLVVINQKSPKTILKLSKQISSYKKKVKEGTDMYILIYGIDAQIQDLLNTQENTEEKIYNNPEKNTFNNSFNTAKKYLENDVYNNSKLLQNTFYCGCDYSSDKNIDKSSCGFQNNGKYISRSQKIEWEHVVPAHAFGQSFTEWREGNPSCIDSKGNSFKGRNCASKVNQEYRYMESDMYNLVPSIGSINALRSNYSFVMIPGETREFGTCDIEIQDQKVEPKEEIRGDIARIYMYMDLTYPDRGIISEKNKKLYDVWNREDVVSEKECERYKSIKAIQGNENVILAEACK